MHFAFIKMISLCLLFLCVLAICVDSPSLDINDLLTNRTIEAFDLLESNRIDEAENTLNSVLIYATISNTTVSKSLFSSLRWSSWYRMHSVIARKRGNLPAAADYLESACSILESIPGVNINKVIACHYELVSLLANSGELDRALRLKSALFEKPFFDSEAWEHANRR